VPASEVQALKGLESFYLFSLSYLFFLSSWALASEKHTSVALVWTALTWEVLVKGQLVSEELALARKV
jgi:hypothetical protein